MDTHIFFWGDYLSNFHPANFIFDGLKVHSSEQAYMLRKAMYFGDYNAASNILDASHPAECKKWGRKVEDYNDAAWKFVCMDHMDDAVFAKFSQNKYLRDMLLATNDKILVEASPFDTYWGIGLGPDNPMRFNENMWLGENKLGIVLMDVRSRLC